MKNNPFEHPELARVSSKGQIVIPETIRKQLNIKEGNMFATASFDHNLIILKKLKSPFAREDLSMIRQVDSAWNEIEKGKCRTMGKEDFLKEIKKW